MIVKLSIAELLDRRTCIWVLPLDTGCMDKLSCRVLHPPSPMECPPHIPIFRVKRENYFIRLLWVDGGRILPCSLLGRQLIILGSLLDALMV